ncbi:MAG: DUF4263 domain-containing protein [Candidatus Kapabacteria bacterium]|nr:DUF4263 domain-containing protein [Candidatus Kapabacteria bacterium]
MGAFNQEIPESKPTTQEIILNSLTDQLYCNDQKKIKFFSVVFDDKIELELNISAKTQIKVTYVKDHDDLKGLEITRIKSNSVVERINFSMFTLHHLIEFTEILSNIDFANHTEKKVPIHRKIDADSVEKIKQFLMSNDGEELLETILNEGGITSKDVVNIGFRKNSLDTFKKLLDEPNYWKEYAQDISVSGAHEEKVWQHFFNLNQWIFGYGLDYRFNEVLQKEASISHTHIDGSNTVITDFLLGDNNFVTFVELKKPSTNLFAKNQNRANSWKLSTEFFESVSQILEQKSSGIIKFETEQFTDRDEKIHQKAFDSKVILIIGSWKQIDDKTDREKSIMKKTFELFRRDSRNVEIITYDELYQRAEFIVKGSEPKNK